MERIKVHLQDTGNVMSVRFKPHRSIDLYRISQTLSVRLHNLKKTFLPFDLRGKFAL